MLEDIEAIYLGMNYMLYPRMFRHLSGTVDQLDSAGNVWGFFRPIMRIIIFIADAET